MRKENREMRKLYGAGVRCRLLVLCVAGAAVLATGCGGGGSSTSAGGGFVAQANSLCHSISALYLKRAKVELQATQEIGAHPSEWKHISEETAATTKAYLGEIEADLGKMNALTAPPAVRRPYESLVVTMREMAAAARGPEKNLKKHVEDKNRSAKAAGLQECGAFEQGA